MPTASKQGQTTSAKMPKVPKTQNKTTVAPASTAPDAAPVEAIVPPSPAEVAPVAKKARQPKKMKPTPTPTSIPVPMEDDSSSVVAASTVSVATSVTTTTVDSSGGKKKKPTKKRGKKGKGIGTRTPSSYVLFSMDHRKKIIEEHPDYSLGEVSKLCGVAWKTLDDTSKQPWVDQASDLKRKRMTEIEELKKDEPPKKKRTPSSYLLFAMDYRQTVLKDNPGMAIGDVSKLCGAKWKTLADAEKTVWKQKADAMKPAVAS